MAWFVGIILFIIFRLAWKSHRAHETQFQTSSQSASTYPLDNSLLYSWPPLGDFDFEIVGESNYQMNILKIVTHSPNQSEWEAVITPEDSNPYDDKAVKVEIDGLLVGYMDRETARSYRRRLKNKLQTMQPTRTLAIITGGHMRNGKQLNYGICLDLKPFE